MRITAPQDQYYFKIRASSPYGTVDSTPIEVVVADFCLETQYVIEVTEIEIDITVLGPVVTKPFDKPVSELELEMDQKNICGPIVYQLILQNGPTGSSLNPVIDQTEPTISAASTN